MGGSESDKKPLGRPPGRKDAAKRVRRTEAEQQRDAAVTAGLVNALGGTQPPQKPEQLVLDGREPRRQPTEQGGPLFGNAAPTYNGYVWPNSSAGFGRLNPEKPKK